jgi:WD40 repeat protein/serine/threonine protein kinase
MAAELDTVTDADGLLEEVLASYLRAVDAGQSPDPNDVIARHPHLAAELRAAFADAAFLEPVLEPIRMPAPALTPPESFPQAFGDYELRGLLGFGGMGKVYIGRHKGLNKDHAVKTMRDQEGASPEDVQRFRREAENAARLDHANIVPIYHVGEHEGRVFLSMKLVEGGSLADHMKAFAGRPRATARLMAQVARAVHHAHQHLVIHRDLKPANILLAPLDSAAGAARAEAKAITKAGGASSAAAAKAEKMEELQDPDGVVPFVTDFGLACRIDDTATLSPAGTVLGTPGFMAPEQAAGAKEVSTAADVYGLGAVLYTMLTGRPPFRGKNPAETLEQTRNQEPVPPRQFNAKVDRDLEAICLRCLKKDPSKRYGSSAGAVADDLQRYLERRPIKARRVGRVERAIKWVRRRPAIAALTAVIVLVALLGIGGVVWKWRDEVALYERQAAVLYVNRINLALKFLEDGQPHQAETQLGYCPPALRGWEWFFLKHLCRRDPIELAHHSGLVVAVQYSPDGSLLATGGQDGVVNLWKAATGELLRTLGDGAAPGVAHPGGADAVCFTRQGPRLLLVTAGEDQTVRVWDAATGQLRQELPNEGHLAAASPDRPRFASVGRDSVVRVWDAEAPDGLFREVHREDLRGEKALIAGIALSVDGRRVAICGFGGLVRVWDGSMDWRLIPLPAEASVGSANVWAIAFSADGASLAVGGPQPFLWKLDAQQNSLRFFSDPGDQRCGGLAFSPNGKLLAATFRDGLVRVWDTDRWTIALTPGKPEGHKYGLAFSPDGKRLALAWKAQAIVEPMDSTPMNSTPMNSKPLIGGRVLVERDDPTIRTLAFGPDGRLAYRAGDNVILADPLTAVLQPPAPIGGHVADGANLVWGPDGRLYSGRPGNSLWVWDGNSEPKDDLNIPAADTRCCAVSDDGRTLATTKGDNVIDLWDLPGGARRLSCQGGGDIKALAFRPRHAQLVSCGADGEVHLWDAVTGKQVRAFSGGSKAVTALACSADGAMLAAAGSDLMVHVWDPDNGREVCSLTGHYGCVTGVSFSPDGRRIASCATDGKVKIWDAQSGEEVLTLSGHEGAVDALAFNGEGSLLATCSRDGTVRLWDAPRTEK